MSRYEDIPSEVRALLPSACDDGLTPEEAARLEDACNDDARVRLLVDYLQLDADLSILMQGDEALARSLKLIGAHSGKAGHSTPTTPMDVGAPFLGTFGNTSHGVIGYFSLVGPFSYLIATFIMLVMGIVAWAWKLPNYAETARSSSRPGVERRFAGGSRMEFVGRITGMVDCQWADPHTAVPGPVAVPLGRKYALASGLLEITYDTDAKVILQGPATYEVESKDGGYLSEGKLTVKVEKGSGFRVQESEAANQKSEIRSHKLFSLRTPTATVTDLGTEFAVEVAESGHMFAHVYDGVIEIQPVGRDGQRGRAVRLTENESARAEKDIAGEVAIVRDSKKAPATFVRVGQLSKAAEDLRLKPFRRWQTLSEGLRRDPSLLAYYDFQQKEGTPSVLPNVAANGDRSLDGVVENATWTTGRMPGKHALRFNGPDDYVRMNLPQETDDLTLAAWIYVESLDDELTGLFMSDCWGHEGQLHWQLTRDGIVALDPYDTSGRAWIYKSAAVFDDRHFRRWTHIAVVYDHTVKAIRFYADGNPVGGADILMVTPLCIREARLGQWNMQGFNGWGGIARQFHGQIDELAIFSRPLSAEEIQRLFDTRIAATGRQDMIGESAGARRDVNGERQERQQP